MNQYSELVRVAEYLFNKYKDKDLSSINPDKRVRAVRTPISQDEHDKILRLFEQQNITVSELANRFNRSVGVVSLIVNRKHKLLKAG
jgi:hypothetical protein